MPLARLNRLLLAAALAAPALCCASPAPAQETREKSPLTNDRVAAMVRNGVSEDIILALIDKFPDRLDGGPEALVELKKAGASNKVLLAVRRSGLASQAAAEEAANPVISDEPEQEAAPGGEAGEPAAAGPRPHPFSDGYLSLGLGYPFVAAKYDFLDYAVEARYLQRQEREARAISFRAYWNFHRRGPWTAYVGGEGGRAWFGTGSRVSGAWELAPVLGGGYEFHKDLTLAADISPTLLVSDHGGTDFDLDNLGWYVNLAVFFRMPKLEAKSGLAADEANTAAMDRERADEDLAAWRLQKGPARRATYDERVERAARYASQQDYPEADEEYAKALEELKDSDARRVFLHERRGWVALKQEGPEAAKGHYLEAVATARRLEAYGSDLVNAYCGLAYVFEKLEQNDLAIRNYEKALDIAPSEAVRRQIGKALRRLRTGDTGD